MFVRVLVLALLAAWPVAAQVYDLGNRQYLTVPPPAGFCPYNLQSEQERAMVAESQKMLTQGSLLVATFGHCAEMQTARTRGGYMFAKIDVIVPRAGNAPIVRTHTREQFGKTMFPRAGKPLDFNRLFDASGRFTGHMPTTATGQRAELTGPWFADAQGLWLASLSSRFIDGGTVPLSTALTVTLITGIEVHVRHRRVLTTRDALNALVAENRAYVGQLIAANERR
jgi:hypothetical protein